MMRWFDRLAWAARNMKWTLTLCACCLLAIGLAFVYGASFVSEETQVRPFFQKQIVWAVIGLLIYITAAAFDYRTLCRLSWAFYLFALALLVIVLAMGGERYGARRWLAMGGFSIQPSEFAKPALVLALAAMLNRAGEDLGAAGVLCRVLGVAVLPMLLILKEPDLGTVIIFVPIVAAMLFAAGAPRRTLLSLTAIGLIATSVVLAIVIVPEKAGMSEDDQARILKLAGMSPYQKKRIMTFLDPGRDPLGAGWNKLQSEIAVGSGGIFGKGFMKGDQNTLGFLPRSVAPTDFIFSVIAEETGFAGSAAVLMLFAVLLMSGLNVAASAADKQGRLLCTGVAAMIFGHVFINIAMTIGLAPITGLPLPLVSYGGSSVLSTMAGLGLIQSVYLRSRRR